MTRTMDYSDFLSEIQARIDSTANDADLAQLIRDVVHSMNRNQYAYNFTWLGVPIIQTPQDMSMLQELIWEAKPDCIIETGIAHGGSLIFSASMLKVLESMGLVEHPLVVGIDVDIRPRARELLNSHPLAQNIVAFEGSSTDQRIVNSIKSLCGNRDRVMVCLDSDHTHNHVLSELREYAPLVTKDSFCVVFDTGIEDLSPDAIAKGRNWGSGNSPASALAAFLRENKDFTVEDYYHRKSWFSSAPQGVLRRLS